MLDVENPCEEAVKTTGLSDSKVQGIRTGVYGKITQKAGQVVVVQEPYSDLISQRIHIDVLPLPQTVFQGRDQQKSGDLPGSSDARILRNNCVIDPD